MEKITVAIIRNPFDPVNSREIRKFDAGLTVGRAMQELFPLATTSYDWTVAVNGRIVDGDYRDIRLVAGDSLTFCATPQGGGGGSKNPLATVAMLAVVIAAPVAAGALIGATALTGAMATMATTTLTAGLMFGGGLLVNSIFPAKLPQFDGHKSNWEQSQTYGWAIGPNAVDVGGVLPDLYGTFRITPKVLSRYVETQGDKQYLNMLLCAAGHQVDSISDIKINDQPVDNFSDIIINTRLGANNQTVISHFSDTRNDTAIGSKFTTSWQTRQLSSDVDSFGVGLVAPQGLWRVNDKGKLVDNSVNIEIQYRKIGDVSWQTWINQALTSNKNTPLRWFFEQEAPYASFNQYEYRYRFSSEPNTGTRYASDLWLDYHQQVVKDPLIYPNTALIGVRALATDQLSGSEPRITALVSRNTVPVYTGSAYENKPATNPAWINYHQLHDRISGGGVSADRIIFDDFEAFADWCTAEDFTCNIYFDTAQNLKSAMDTVSMLGRGQVVQIGSRFSVFVDKPDEAVQRFSFGMGNMEEGSFQEEWLPMTDRADMIEVTYWDVNNNYQREIVTIHQDGFDELEREANVQSITLYGCTNRNMAARHGKFLLNKNRYLTLTSSWGADIDAIACRVNDVVDVSHDVPEWGYSGRVVNADTNELVLDREVTMVPGTTYIVEVRHKDDTRESHIMTVSSSTTTDTLTITEGWANLPQKYDNYLFGEVEKHYKKFRILNISRDSDLRRKITALEYIPEVFDDSVTVPPPATLTIGAITSLRASEVWTTSPDGSSISIVNLSWRGSGGEFEVFYRRNATMDPWVSLGTTRNSFFQIDFPLTQEITYDFKVARTDGLGSATTDLTIEGKPWAPSTPEGLSLTATSAGILAKWSHITDIDRKEYIINLNGIEHTRTAANSHTIELPLPPQSYSVEVVAVSWDEQESEPLSANITILAPTQPTVTSQVLATEIRLNWNDCKTSFPISHYTVNGEVVTGRVYSEPITWAGDKDFIVTAFDVSGNEGPAVTETVTILTIPAPTTLIPTGRPYEIKLDFTYIKTDQFQALEIWASHLNNRNGAQKIAETGGTSHTVSGLNIGDTRYFWIRVRNKFGGHSNWYPEAHNAGVLGAVSTDPTMYLDILTGEIDETILSAGLAGRIDLIDTSFIWDDIYEEEVESGLDGSFSGLYGIQQTFRTEISAEAIRVDNLMARVEDNETDILARATIDQLNQAKVDIYGASVESFTNLNAEFNGVNASISENSTAISTLDGQVKAEKTLWLNANGHVTGYRNAITGGGESTFDIVTNRFRIINQYDPEDVRVPFVVGTVNGVSTVGIDGNLVVDGSVLASSIAADAINGSHISADSDIIIGDIENGDYCRIHDGDIEFWKYISGSHVMYKSLKKFEYGTGKNDTVITVPGPWDAEPEILVTPHSIMCYNHNYSNQSQTMEMGIQKLGMTAQKDYQFIPTMRLTLGSADTTITYNQTVTTENISDALYSTNRTTPANTSQITVTGGFSIVWYRTYTTPDGYTFDQPGSGTISLYALVNDANHLMQSINFSRSASWNGSKTINLSPGTHSYRLRLVVTNPYISDTGLGWTTNRNMSLTHTSTEFDMVAVNDMLAEGSVNWWAIGE